MILSLLNQNKTLIGELDQLDNCYITELLETGEDTLSFEIYVKHPLYKHLVEENLILTEDNRYVIKSIDERGQTTIIGCVLDLSDLMVAGYHLLLLEEITLSAFLNQVLSSAGWTFTGAESITSAKTVSLESGNTLELLRLAEKIYGIIFRYDCIGKDYPSHHHPRLHQQRRSFFPTNSTSRSVNSGVIALTWSLACMPLAKTD